MKYRLVGALAPFPLNMQIGFTSAYRNDERDDWAILYDRVIEALINEGPESINIRRSERPILRLARALDEVCEVNGDPLWLSEVVWPIFQAFSVALDYETGRLSGGRMWLSIWASTTVAKAGLDPETGDTIGADRFVLWLDGAYEGHYFTEVKLVNALHKKHSYSADHAIKYEGYSVTQNGKDISAQFVSADTQ